jgi:hypothetical protein
MGDMVLQLRYFEDETSPYALLDIWRVTDDDALGGVALNGLALYGVTTIESLEGRRFAFDDSNDGNAELRESVFIQPNDDESLEIDSLVIAFLRRQDDDFELEMRASCFDSQTAGISVEIHGVARILVAC